MLRADLGVDGCTMGHCHNADPFFYLRAQMLFRAFKYVAAGLHSAILFNHSSDPSGVDTTAFWSTILAAETRCIIPYRRIDAWFGAVLGYFRWQWDGRMEGERGRIWFNAFSLGWGFGTDYYINSKVGIGFSFYVYKPWPREMCLIYGGEECTGLSPEAKDEIGFWWTLGFSATYHKIL